jgi:hypothetical protein
VSATSQIRVGERVELARYSVVEGERVLYGQRVNGIVRITDCPATGRSRAFLVERGLTQCAELDALLADYVRQAERHGMVPMLLDWLLA